MIRLLGAMLLALACATGALAQGTRVVPEASGEARRLWFEVTITPRAVATNGAWPGEQLVMEVRLISSDPLQRLRLVMPKIADAWVDTLVRPHTLQINMFGGRGYSHEARYVIFPKSAGTLVIPPIRVTGIREELGGRAVEFEEEFAEQRIPVHAPPETFTDPWVVAHRVNLKESWSTDVNAIHGGDTVRRTVTLTVPGVRAEDLPELTLTANDGYRVLASDVVAETERTSAGFTARLQQSWDIYVETDDIFHVDPVRFAYFDPVEAAVRVVGAPRQRVEPLRRDADALRASLRAGVMDDLWYKRIGLIVLLALPAVALALFVLASVLAALPTRADIRFWRAARQSDGPLDYYGDFIAWGRRSLADRPIVGEKEAGRLGRPAVEDVGRMHNALFAAGGGSFDRRGMTRRLVQAAVSARLRRLWGAVMSRLSRLLFLE